MGKMSILASWKFWVVFIIVIVFILWLFFGTGKYRFTGTKDSKTTDKSDILYKPKSKVSNFRRQFEPNSSSEDSRSSYTTPLQTPLQTPQVYTPYDDQTCVSTPATQFSEFDMYSSTDSESDYVSRYDDSSTPFTMNSRTPMTNFSENISPIYRRAKVTPRFNDTPKFNNNPSISSSHKISPHHSISPSIRTPFSMSDSSSQYTESPLILGPIPQNSPPNNIKTFNQVKNTSVSWPSEVPLSTDHILKMQADISLQEALKDASKEKKVPAESRGEAICRQVLEDIYKRKFPSTRPDFLKNPETGYNLELDGYCEELQIAFEYNGVQHYVFPNFAHRSEDDFRKQVRRDQYKIEACNSSGIYLISVPYNIPHNQIRDYIIYFLPENVHERNDARTKDEDDYNGVCHSNSNNSESVEGGLIHL